MKTNRRARGAWFALASLLASAAAHAQPTASPAPSNDLLGLPLEALVDLPVTSVAKREQRLSEAAAAVFVITSEDIRRSGATSLPEALRMAPGLEVARITGGAWAVSARGYNGRFATKLLVLVDGRSVYTPLFSGVFWDGQDVPLEDIERIEVIRGPGASLWGANAVNGVINVITKPAAATLGGLASASVGDVDRAGAFLRWGDQAEGNTRYRVYAQGATREAGAPFTTPAPNDRWKRWRTGFRADRGDGMDALTLQGEFASSRLGDRVQVGDLQPPYARSIDSTLENETGHLRALWRRKVAPDSTVSLQAWASHDEVSYIGAHEKRGTADVEFQHAIRSGAHDFTWGIGYRYTRSDLRNLHIAGEGPITGAQVDPPDHRLHLASLFAQEEYALVPGRWQLTAGARLEHNAFTGAEFLPNLRLAFTPDASNTLWAAVSRAVRSPSIIERDVSVRLNVIAPGTPANPGPLPVLIDVRGSDSFRSETMVSVEAGYRTRLSPTLSMDLAAYGSRYDDLRSTRFGAPEIATRPVPHLVVPLDFTNDESARVRGFEAAADWRPLPAWRVQGSYTYTKLTKDTPAERLAYPIERDTPTHQGSLRFAHSPRRNLDADLWVRYVGAVQVEGVPIPRYVALDARLAWRPSRDVELWVAGQNLTDRCHPEFVSDFLGSVATEVRRSVQAGVRVGF